MMFHQIKYLGGLPYPFDSSGYIDISIDNANKTATFSKPGNGGIRLFRNGILSVETDIQHERSLGKGVAGYIIGNILNKKYGGLIGAAIGARRKDVSMLYIRFRLNNIQNTIVLKPEKKTWDLYAALNSIKY